MSDGAAKKIEGIKKLYGIGKPDGLNTNYEGMTFFRLHRFILDADRKPVGEEKTVLKMADVGLYLLLMFFSKEMLYNGKDGAKLPAFDSELIKVIIKDTTKKKVMDSRSAKVIKTSFHKLNELGLIKCTTIKNDKTEIYKDIEVPFTHDDFTTGGFFKFYNIDMDTLLANIKTGNRKFGVKEFLELLGVYAVSCLIFYKDSKKDKPLNNGIVTVAQTPTRRYANRIDYTFGLKLSGGARKKGVREYMDILDEMGVMITTTIQEDDKVFSVYTFPKNFEQLEKVIKDAYKD